MFGLTTKDLAYQANVTPSTIRATLSRKGNYLGIKPIRLHNGRLLWPAEEVDIALHTFTFIQPWFGHKVRDIGEARAFLSAIATAMENQRDYILSGATSKDDEEHRIIRIEIENIQIVLSRLQRGFAGENTI